MSKTPSVLRLRVSLEEIEPQPWREFEILSSRTLAHLHDAIQAAFLWHDMHLWSFAIGTRRYEMKDRSDELQGLIGPPVHNARTKKLDFFLKDAVPPVLYTYDFGDDWHHRVVPVSNRPVQEGEALPRFVGGEWATPPEDIGGPPVYEIFKEARENPEHPDHARAQEVGTPDWAHDAIHEPAIRQQFKRLQTQKQRASPYAWVRG